MNNTNIPDHIFNIFNSKTIEEAIIKVNNIEDYNNMDIEEIISIHAKNGNKEIVNQLRDIQSRGFNEIKINVSCLKENLKVTLNKDGFYELI